MLRHRPLDVLTYFQLPFKDEGSEKPWVIVSCPFHNDSEDLDKAHGGIHKENGAFKCFSCDAKKQNVITVVATVMKVQVAAVESIVDNTFGTRKMHGKSEDLDPSFVEFCHANLLNNEEQLLNLQSKHGINAASVDRFKLGFVHYLNRISIPVFSQDGQLINIRYYSYDPGSKVKIQGPKNVATSLFNTNAVLQNKSVIVTEGEFKAIILEQHGFKACSGTGGSKTWKPEWSALFKGKDVVVIYDVDEAGRTGSVKVCNGLYPYVNSIKNVFLHPVSNDPKGSIKEFFLLGLSAIELQTIIDTTALYRPVDMPIIELDNSDPIAVQLARASRAEYNGKRIETTAVVSAKDTAPYIVPKTCTVVCPRDRDYCNVCCVHTSKEPHTFTIEPDAPILLDLLDCGEEQQNRILKKISRVYQGCKVAAFKRVESYNIEEVRAVPQINIGCTTEEQVTRKIYSVGHGLNANCSYKFTGRVCPQPGDGHATLIAYKSDTVEDDLDNFKAQHDLSVFQPTDWSVASINAKLDDVYNDLETNVTRVYMRRDMHVFVDLAFHSVLFVNLQGRRDIKGWLDVLIMGDSGQAKSECTEKLRQHYKAGESIDTKKASIAGLVGGCQATDKRWFLTWGTIPLNDRRLVILEEIKGMGTRELATMTDMRSRGIAQIVKIERAVTHARTRLIWISNPRSDNTMSTYNYGVSAVKELIGSLEDIRRFDMVMAVARGEVPQEIVNKRSRDGDVPHQYTSELCSHLVGWAWSRGKDQVVFEADAEEEILIQATRMGKDFSSSCPIVESSDQRLKLARLSAALAARTFSTDDGHILIVRKAHVTIVVEFLYRIYSSKALGYLDYSIAQRGESTIIDEGTIKAVIRGLPNGDTCVQAILEAELIVEQDLMNYTEWPIEQCSNTIGILARNNCLKRSKRGGYRKTSAFIEILKVLQLDGTLNKHTYRETISQQGSM